MTEPKLMLCEKCEALQDADLLCKPCHNNRLAIEHWVGKHNQACEMVAHMTASRNRWRRMAEDIFDCFKEDGK